MENEPTKRAWPRWLVPLGCCAAMLVLFAGLSISAALTKSATSDEPLHLACGLAKTFNGDFRMNAEDPALFGWLASLPFSRKSIELDSHMPIPKEMHDAYHSDQWYFAVVTLFRTPRNDGDAMIQRSRFVFAMIGMLLGGLIMLWSWQLAGASAAIIATAFFAFDPNFLGHAALVKNDVLMALAMGTMAWSLWRFGKTGLLRWMLLSALACAAAMNVKFSGVLCAPILIVVLLVRALLPQPWYFLGKLRTTVFQKLFISSSAILLAAIVAYAGIWVCYDLRYAPTASPGETLDSAPIVRRIKRDRIVARSNNDQNAGTDERIASEPNGLTVDWVLWADAHHVLPQAWLWGFLYTYATTILRNSYLLGTVSYQGWWYYFPCAVLFKTPTATLLAAVGAIAVLVISLIKLRGQSEKIQSISWTIAAMLIPPGIYFLLAMQSSMNLGLRHVLPIYPYIFVGVGAALAWVIDRWRRAGIAAASLLAVLVASETAAAYPDYIAFFNTPSGGSAGGFNLLGDSNLDWGQDLKLLAEWQRRVPQGTLYLNYFGGADPEFYGVHARALPGGWMFSPKYPFPSSTDTCYVAVSATNLQGIFYDEEERRGYQVLLDFRPSVILGGSIYIYQFPIPESMRKVRR